MQVTLNMYEMRPSLVADLVLALQTDQRLCGDDVDEQSLINAIATLTAYGESMDENWQQMGWLHDAS